jgi:chromate transporter
LPAAPTPCSRSSPSKRSRPYGWLTAADMVRGLGLTETIPGPLIMVVQFVAFLGAYAAPGPLTPWVAGVGTSLLVTWVTFVPSFLFIFLGAPTSDACAATAPWPAP